MVNESTVILVVGLVFGLPLACLWFVGIAYVIMDALVGIHDTWKELRNKQDETK